MIIIALTGIVRYDVIIDARPLFFHIFEKKNTVPKTIRKNTSDSIPDELYECNFDSPLCVSINV